MMAASASRFTPRAASHHQGVASLRDSALAHSTLRMYSNHVQSFLSFAHVSPGQLRKKPGEWIDGRLAAYIEYLFANGRPFHHACHTLYGLIFQRPALKTQLGESRLRVRGWERRNAGSKRSHPPLTWELTVVLAVTLARSGFHAHAVAMLLAFHCYLRVGELCRLQRRDVIAVNDPRMGRACTRMSLRLARTKTGKNQWVDVRDDAVAQLMTSWLQHPSVGASPRAAVFPFSDSHFRSMMCRARDAVGLDHIPYVPHSLRHGGATSDFLRGDTIEQVLFRGRWKESKSARVYLQTGRALYALHQVPSRLVQLGDQLDAELVGVLTTLRTTVPLRVQVSRRVRFSEQ